MKKIKANKNTFVARCICALVALIISEYQYFSLYPSNFRSTTSKVRHFSEPDVVRTTTSFIKPTPTNHNLTEIVRDGVLARAYTWNKSLPCLPPDFPMKQKNGYRQPATSGFLYMKLMKTGGSTAAGVTMRIAKRTAERGHEKFWICRGRWDHGWAFKMLKDRRREDSFTWTNLREPTKRAVSQFFHFQVSRENVSSSDESFKRYLKTGENSKVQRNLYLRVLSIKNVLVFDDTAPSIINAILSEYDFIGITERMDESVVALMMLLNLPMGDILYLDAKGHGGYDDGVHRNTCFFIQPSKVSPGMHSFFNGPYWNELTKWDRLLYEAANRSLDLTIHRLGKDKFNKNLLMFQYANEVARDRCLPQNVFPCTSTGQRNNNSSCLWSDSGCGYKCLDQVANDLSLS
jgi:hypothetical protein